LVFAVSAALAGTALATLLAGIITTVADASSTTTAEIAVTAPDISLCGSTACRAYFFA